ncbi:MAG: 2TM domain-containing protein [Bacteroidota bacterium]
MHDETYRQAQKVVKKKKGFYSHLAVYVAVGAFFLLMNLATFDSGGREWWFFFPLLPWGVGLAIHYFGTFGLPGTDILTKEWEERETEKEMRRLYEQNPELGIDDHLELRDVDEMKDKNWKNSDEDYV